MRVKYSENEINSKNHKYLNGTLRVQDLCPKYMLELRNMSSMSTFYIKLKFILFFRRICRVEFDFSSVSVWVQKLIRRFQTSDLTDLLYL